MKKRALRDMRKDSSLSSRTNFPGEIQEKTPVRPRVSVQQRDAEIGKRIMKATGGKK